MRNLSVVVFYLLLANVLVSTAIAKDKNNVNTETFNGNFRLGFIAKDNDQNEREISSAVGGKLGYVSSSLHGLTVSATAYTTQKLFNDENGDFFDSDGSGYTILGEVFLQGNFANTQIKGGRFEFDSPHIDTDDIRMVPNTYTGISLVNSDIKNTIIYAAHLDKMAGVAAIKPEKFIDLNTDIGMNVVGVRYQGLKHLNLQAWLYQGKDFADYFYADAIYEFDNVTIGIQLGSQSDNTHDKRVADGDFYGFKASYQYRDVIFNTAYNKVSGTVCSGLGGGPFFSNAADHTIDDILDQSALALGLDYTGITGLTVGVLNVAFDKGADETDIVLNYELKHDMAIELTYHHMRADGDMILFMFNKGF